MSWRTCPAPAGLLLALATGCALPKVALGGSVSLGSAVGPEGSGRGQLRSAVWLALIYAPDADSSDRPALTIASAVELPGPQPSAVPCAFEAACAIEREAYESEREEELSP